MNLLLDTHVLLWWLADDPALSARARAAIGHTDNLVYVSAVTLWEIVIKRSLGKLDLPGDWAEVLAREPFRRLPVTWDHALRVAQLPNVHRDPFDRLLIAQAMEEDLVLVTGDELLARYTAQTLQARG
jgi:PIN domain nuclease of toxin-antitoxin system